MFEKDKEILLVDLKDSPLKKLKNLKATKSRIYTELFLFI